MSRRFYIDSDIGRLIGVVVQGERFYILKAEDESGRFDRRHSVVLRDAPIDRLIDRSLKYSYELVRGDERKRVLNEYARGKR